ncbi:MAG: hypothetical protein ACJ70T_07010 [Nitrososphaera sp.]
MPPTLDHPSSSMALQTASPLLLKIFTGVQDYQLESEDNQHPLISGHSEEL